MSSAKGTDGEPFADEYALQVFGAVVAIVGDDERAGFETAFHPIENDMRRLRWGCLLRVRRRLLMAWIARYRQVWDQRFAALDGVIDELKRQEKARGRKKRK